MTIYLAKPRGFCAGVERAIEVVEQALLFYGAPIYVRHEVVHNKSVCARLADLGAKFVDELSEVPVGKPVIFSAHGVSPMVKDEARRLGLVGIDATCPLVTKVHAEVLHYARLGFEILLVGHKDHVEVLGTFGHAPHQTQIIETVEDAKHCQVLDPQKVAFVTQTTLSMDDLKEIVDILKRHFPLIHGPKKDDICYATQNRQLAVKSLVEGGSGRSKIELLLVVGDTQSSNANRLVDVAKARGVEAYLVSDWSSVPLERVLLKDSIGVTAGASTPEDLVQDICLKLRELKKTDICEVESAVERIKFQIPPMPKIASEISL